MSAISFTICTFEQVHICNHITFYLFKYFLFQMILFEILVVGLDNLRLWVDHLPSWLCTFYIILRSFLFNAIVLILCILTFIKFTFLCVMKRIPEMNDECISRAIIGSVCIWGVVEVCVKFLMFENKPVVNEVGTYDVIYCTIICLCKNLSGNTILDFLHYSAYVWDTMIKLGRS